MAPQQGYDEPGILSYAIRPFCPTSADGLQSTSRLPSYRSQECSAFGQLKLNAAIAPIGVLGGAGIDRLKFAEPGGDQAGRLDAHNDQILDYGVARAADRSQFDLNSLKTIGRTSV